MTNRDITEVEKMAHLRISIDNAGYYHSSFKYSSITRLHQIGKMHGPKRVAAFCTVIVVIPTLLIIAPLYLRHSIYNEVRFSVTESDVVEVTEGVSSIFCQSHVLVMNTTFNAFQLRGKPEPTDARKHIRLKKSMVLPDDTLEYWGFYLLKGAAVTLKVCSRFKGSRLLVVRGDRNLRTCGLLNHNANKFGPHYDKEHNQVKVTFETIAQEITEDDSNSDNHGGENLEESEDKIADEYIEKHKNITAKHNKRYIHRHSYKIKKLELQELQEDGKRTKRNTPGHVLDGPIAHGGTALNYTESTEDSFSSFETDLLACYDGQILLNQGFYPSRHCKNVHYLQRANHMNAKHEVISDGYYYYIFFSDNDDVQNDVHAVFDIYKPTFQYSNVSKLRQCINNTECSFPITFGSDETVVVEVPTRDGIEHEEDDVSVLLSVCEPRMSIYIIFPIAILLFILSCAFL